VEPETGPALEPGLEVATIPRQRWRLVLSREAGPGGLTGRDLTAAWETALDACGLPVHRPIGKGRSRIALGAPVPAAIALEHELADVVLAEFCPAWVVREAMVGRVPEGWQLVDLHDVWLGAPALAGQVAAADYRIELGGADQDAIARAAATVLASPHLPRQRTKGGSVVAYDLRPLLINVAVADTGQPVVIQARTRFDPALGTGRPEEVVAALGDVVGVELTIGRVVRERLILADELEG
jgi:uncharacterized protein DUF2344